MVFACGRAAAETPPAMPAVFPAGAIAFAELNGLDPKLEQLRSSEFLAAWLESPQYQRYEASPDYRRLEAVLKIAERQLGWDAWTTATKLLGGTLAVGVYPKEGSKQPDVLGIIRPSDPAALADLRERLDPLLVLAEEQIRRTESVGGIETLALPKDAAFIAWKGRWLAISSSRALLDEALRRLGGSRNEEKLAALDGDDSYLKMAKSIDWEHAGDSSDRVRLLRAYVNTALLNKATGGKPIPEKLDNALGSLLFGDLVNSLRTSPFAAATVDISADGLLISASLSRESAKPDDAHQAFVPSDGRGVSPTPRVPDLVGSFTIYRDFTHWYTHREELLQEQILPGFDKFETGLANILPGSDFGEDVLPLIGKRITFVAAPQDYSHLDGEPGVKLPGMAVLVELAKPDEATTVLQLFFQTLAAILNLEAGQQGRQPWVVTSEAYRDVQVSYARYLQKPSGKDLGIVYNFLPASARVDDQFIISSSLPLCKQLIDALRDGSNSQGDNTSAQTLRAELQFDALAGIIESDADFFVGRMQQEGRTADEARVEFAAIVDMLRRFESLEAATELQPDVFKLRIEGNWK
ncbi:MAG TPA: DUF3352 domain-containing protein [Lacipirellulaceae bacterium]|nr:DUF3352 domain-containing protein [Lacipirellulaceae bacterium]